MLAKAVPSVPEPDSADGGLAYEPKWDGFRAIVYLDENGCEIGSRGSKMLTRYFPELVDAFTRLVREPCVLDGEIIVRTGEPGHERLDWEALSQRIHPAARRIRELVESTPASFVAFDLVSRSDESLLDKPFSERRARLEAFLGSVPAPIHLTQLTYDAELARRWFVEFEGAGLDGVVAKPLSAPYNPGKRTMLKAKHHRSADVVPYGYRIHKSGTGVGSLLLGLYDDTGTLRPVGGASAFSNARRLELIDELEPYVMHDESGEVMTDETERSRFASGKDVSFIRLKPELVAEVTYDQMEGWRFRHTAQFYRWRPDREPRSCTFEQLDRPVFYDLNEVLS
ncbi:ATP-dependent DNA ligase [Okibacterium endophyticum]